MRYFYLTVLILLQYVIHAAIFPNLKTNVLETWYKDVKTNTDFQKTMRHFQNEKGRYIQGNKLIQKKDLKNDRNLNVFMDLLASKLAENDHRVASRKYNNRRPIFNELKYKKLRSLRRQRLDRGQVKSSDSFSSESEKHREREEMHDDWHFKKMEALNSSILRGDVANMVAARPWAVPCGDALQHDVPWGTCTLEMQCDSEYRIYRGDSVCGRTKFVCCALQPTNYDLYEAIDISMAGTSFSTDSDEKYEVMGSSEIARRKERRERRRRKLERDKRKKKIIKTIKIIIREMKDILNRAYSNVSTERRKRTSRMKQMIKSMKKQFRKDRNAVISAHHAEQEGKDEALQAKLNHVKSINEKFLTNDTFRSIIINGTVDEEKLKSVLREYPQLQQYLKADRRLDGGVADTKSEEVELKLKIEDSNPHMEGYDLEYGMMYF